VADEGTEHHAGAAEELVVVLGRALGLVKASAQPRKQTSAATVARKATRPSSADLFCVIKPIWHRAKKRRSHVDASSGRGQHCFV
jgi:hypothetical protein